MGPKQRTHFVATAHFVAHVQSRRRATENVKNMPADAVHNLRRGGQKYIGFSSNKTSS